jgi:hypothetical protein
MQDRCYASLSEVLCESTLWSQSASSIGREQLIIHLLANSFHCYHGVKQYTTSRIEVASQNADIRLQPVSHEALNSIRALLFALDANKLMRQPAHVCRPGSSHINRFWEAGLELACNVFDAIDQHLMRSSPYEYALDHLVEAGEPIGGCQVGLVVVVWLCGACCLLLAQHSIAKQDRSRTHESG